jgi:geranylgeranyl pyrophosphate synthase
MIVTAAKQTSLPALQAHIAHRLSETIDQLHAPQALKEAIAYSLLAPGKQLRPLLVYGTGLALEANLQQLDHAAMAIECMHCYSLIHDDLPAMDDADTRRGLPSAHKRFGEAQAILVGDALLSLSFECLSTDELDTSIQSELIRILAKASGPEGMVAGQWMDMDPTAKNHIQVQSMHQLKTGALFKACLQMACVIGQRPWTPEWEALAQHIGLCYQLQDDLLDTHGDTHAMGKPSGQDQRLGKSTLSTHLNLAQAQHQLEQHQHGIAQLLTDLQLQHPLLQQVIAMIHQSHTPASISSV